MDATQVEQMGREWLAQNANRHYYLKVELRIDYLAFFVFVHRKGKFNWLFAWQMLPDTLDITMLHQSIAHLVKAVEKLFRRLNRMSRAERKHWRMKNGSA